MKSQRGTRATSVKTKLEGNLEKEEVPPAFDFESYYNKGYQQKVKNIQK